MIQKYDTESASPQLSSLSATKRALVEKFLRGEFTNSEGTGGANRTAGAASTITVRELGQRYEPFPLTDVQQAYWVGRIQGLALGNVAAHSYQELECKDLCLDRFNAALRRLIDRHEMLRAIVLSDGQQRILENVPPYQIELVDARGRDSMWIHSQLSNCRDGMSHQVRRSDEWPLFDIRGFQIDDSAVRLFISFDILLADLWSVRIISRELAQFYENPELELEPIEFSFRDFVLNEIASKESPQYQKAYKYWINRLSSLPPPPELPLAVNPNSISKPRFISRTASLEAEQWARLQSRASKTGLTPSAILLAAFADVLSNWSKSPRFTINLTLFNRPPIYPQINQVVGDFTSLTLLEVDFSGIDSFAERAQRIKEQLWNDLEHRQVSGVQVLRELSRLHGRMSGTLMPVVFTSTLNFDAKNADLLQTALDATLVYSISQTPQVWLDHQVFEQAGTLVFNWDAVEDLFPPEMLDHMFEAYTSHLRRLADEADSWKQTTRLLTPVADDLPHTMFADQSQKRLERPAAKSHEPTLTNGSGASQAKDTGQIAARISDIVSTVLNVNSADLIDNLFDFGANSVDMVRIANKLETEFGLRMGIDEFFNQPTLTAIISFYNERLLESREYLNWVPRGAQSQTQPTVEPVELLLDPEDRENFKKRQPGLRHDLVDKPGLQLAGSETTAELANAYRERKTHRQFLLNPVLLEKLSKLLGSLRQIELDGQPKRWYASAGGLYPVGIYLHIKAGRVERMSPGTYYYHPVEHRLIELSINVELDRTIHGWENRRIFDQSAFSIFLVGHFGAIKPMYGELANNFCMYEAGSIGQLLMMVAPAYEIGLCGIGGLKFDSIRSLFLLEEHDVLLHTLLGGRISPLNVSYHDSERVSVQSEIQQVDQLLRMVKQLSKAEVKALLEAKRKPNAEL